MRDVMKANVLDLFLVACVTLRFVADKSWPDAIGFAVLVLLCWIAGGIVGQVVIALLRSLVRQAGRLSVRTRG